MTSFSQSKLTTVRHEYRLQAPVNIVDLDKVILSAKHDVRATGREVFDDTVHVVGEDEEVVVYWEETEQEAGRLPSPTIGTANFGLAREHRAPFMKRTVADLRESVGTDMLPALSKYTVADAILDHIANTNETGDITLDDLVPLLHSIVDDLHDSAEGHDAAIVRGVAHADHWFMENPAPETVAGMRSLVETIINAAFSEQTAQSDER